MMPGTVFRERARWTRKGGGCAVWLQDGSLNVRRGPFGAYRAIGRPGSLAYAVRLLRRLGGNWQRRGGTAASSRWHEPPREVHANTYAGCVNVGGVWVEKAEPPSTPMKLARIAAYALRVKEQTARARQLAGSLLDEPLTLGEIAAALLHPDAPLSNAEREAATEAIFGGERDDPPGADDGDD